MILSSSLSLEVDTLLKLAIECCLVSMRIVDPLSTVSSKAHPHPLLAGSAKDYATGLGRVGHSLLK
jgi:hypothetical protein